MPLSASLRRTREVLHLLRQVRGAASRRELLRCYRRALADPAAPGLASLTLRCCGRELAVSMRHADVYTLAEIFHERQYPIPDDLPTAPVIVDAGANIGLASLWFLAHRPLATMHCFEPEAKNLELLRHNLSPYPEAHVEDAALGENDGTGTLFLSAEHPALHSDRRPGASDAASVEVRRAALGPYLRRRGVERVDLLKLDVEGAEDWVLAGCGNEIDRIGRIVGELHPRMTDATAVVRRLEDAGFTICRRVAATDPDVELFEAVSGAR